MNKLSLISALHQQTDLSKPAAKQVVEMVFNEMADALVNGDRVEIRGFCSFFVKKYKAYTGLNPKTGAKVAAPRKNYHFLNAGEN